MRLTQRAYRYYIFTQCYFVPICDSKKKKLKLQVLACIVKIFKIFPFQVIYSLEGCKNTMEGRANVPTRTHLIALRARVNALSNILCIVLSCIVILSRRRKRRKRLLRIFPPWPTQRQTSRRQLVVSRSIAVIWRCYISGPPR